MEWKQTRRRRGIDRREELGVEKEGWEEGRKKTGGKRGGGDGREGEWKQTGRRNGGDRRLGREISLFISVLFNSQISRQISKKL